MDKPQITSQSDNFIDFYNYFTVSNAMFTCLLLPYGGFVFGQCDASGIIKYNERLINLVSCLFLRLKWLTRNYNSAFKTILFNILGR